MIGAVNINLKVNKMDIKELIRKTFDECILYKGSENYVWDVSKEDFIEVLVRKLNEEKK